MSFVSMLATDQFISFMSDGRVTDANNNAIVDENFHKVHRINEHTVIAITGSKSVSDTVIKNLDKFNHAKISTFAVSLLEGLQTIPNLPLAFFIIGGIDEKGEIAYTRFESNSKVIQVNTLPLGAIDGQILFNGEDLSFDPNAMFRSKILNLRNAGTNINPLAALKIQSELNNEVALQDFTVNTNVFSELVLKKWKHKRVILWWLFYFD